MTVGAKEETREKENIRKFQLSRKNAGEGGKVAKSFMLSFFDTTKKGGGEEETGRGKC